MRLPRRRRLEKKTDYKARLALLKSGKPRLVIRKSNRYITAQIVQSDIAQDKTICSVSSKSLLNKGWPKDKSGSLKNRTAAYITGFIFGKLAHDKKIKEAIVDTGMYRNIHKSRLYATLKGTLDAGLSVVHSKDILPDVIESDKDFSEILKKITGV